MSWYGTRFFFGPGPTRLLAQLEIRYRDGTRETIATDGSWKTAVSPVLRSEIYAGEVYDARLEQPGWSRPGFVESGWHPAEAAPGPSGLVSAQVSTPVRVSQTLVPRSMKSLGEGVHVFDMGQNVVGWATMSVRGPRGTRVRLRFAEIVNPDGRIYRDNLRNADAEDVYVLRGGGLETFTPQFTFHGFRYVEVSGYPGTPTLAAVRGEVVTSLTGNPTGRLRTSSALVNRFWEVGLWGQRGNFLSVPTDCPQRDERLGWTGDAGVFWRTGAYNFDIASFTTKWLVDVRDAQSPQGAFTNTAPHVPELGEGAPGWGDAGVIVPWTAWMQYGDTQFIVDHWDAMDRWMRYIQDGNPDFVRRHRVGFNFSDWLAPDDRTSKDLVATAYWAMLASRMSEMARAVGRTGDAQRYNSIHENIRAAFARAFVKPNGEVATGTQTSYLMTLHMRLAPEALVPALVSNLVKAIDDRNGHLSTGFLGTPILLFTLADHGRTDVAYRLLLTDTYPSWGYMLSKGATTWWERWNSDSGDPAMNSYNHYAFGSVVAWVYQHVAGIDTSSDGPGFKHIVIRPRLDPRLRHARGEYDSVYGTITTDWATSPGGFTLRATVPPNTTASVHLPRLPGATIMESGRAVTARLDGDRAVVEVGSGSYVFDVRRP
jgi:alpha-L-rhamnosidase